jgi:hypothetical protein
VAATNETWNAAGGLRMVSAGSRLARRRRPVAAFPPIDFPIRDRTRDEVEIEIILKFREHQKHPSHENIFRPGNSAVVPHFIPR